MTAVYNFVWDASSPGAGDWGIREYQLSWTDNGAGNSASTGATNLEVRLGEGVPVHVEARAVGQNGMVSDAAVLDFTTAVRPCTMCDMTVDAPPQPPSVPGNLRADFITFE